MYSSSLKPNAVPCIFLKCWVIFGLNSHLVLFAWTELKNNKQNTTCVFVSCDFAPVSAPGVLKADGTQGPLVSLSSSSSEQASTSKQQYSVEQQLYGTSGPKDDIFSLGGPSYMTASKNCGSRTLGCVSETHCTVEKYSHCWCLTLHCYTENTYNSFISSYHRTAVLDSESSGNSHQSLLEGPSAQPQSNEGQFTQELMGLMIFLFRVCSNSHLTTTKHLHGIIKFILRVTS